MKGKSTPIVKLKISPAKELKLLRKIVEISNSELDLNWILKEFVSIVNEITKADSVFIYLYKEKEESFVLMASKTPHKKELGQVHLKVGEGITGWVAKQNKPVAINKNASQDPRFKYINVLPEDRYEAFLAVPIALKKKVIGVINLQYKKAHDFSESVISLISLIAKQMSGAIINAQLYEDMKTKAVQFDSLVKVSQTITSEAYLDEILNLIVVVTAEMLNSKICSIMLLDKKGNELVIKATQSLSEAYKKKPNLKVSSSISGDVVRSKQPLAIYDVREEQRYHFRELAVKENLCSMLVVPMVVRFKAIGVINIYTEEHHVFTQEEIDVLQMVANQAAISVENTHLMEEALKAKEALEIRKIIERAKGVLMRMAHLNEDEAYRLIHKKSMDSCRSMREIAESVLLMDDLNKSKGLK